MKRLLAALIFFPVAVWAQTSPFSSGSTPPSVSDKGAKFGSPCTYPDAALRVHAVGNTVLAFSVEGDGSIANLKVANSAGNPDLDAAAIQCVAEWRADPSKPEQMRLMSGTIAWSIPASTDGTSAAPVGQFKPLARAGCGSSWYPPAAIKANAEGTALVRIHIDETGAVSGADLLQSTGNAELDRATIGCVTKSWRFRPAMENGKPVAASMQYAIRWSLHPDLQTP